MINPVYNVSKPFLTDSFFKLSQNIKILLYKNNENIFDFLDFEKEKPYTEPLLFAYFNKQGIQNQSLESVIYGYSDKNISFELFSDTTGKIYLPNVGWLLTNHKNDVFNFDKLNFKLFKDNESVAFIYEIPMI